MDPGIPDIGPCIFGRASKDTKGYLIDINSPRAHRRLHVTAYIRAFGPVPEGKEIDHLCGNKDCIEPYHLEAVTKGENLRRRDLDKPYKVYPGSERYKRNQHI